MISKTIFHAFLAFAALTVPAVLLSSCGGGHTIGYAYVTSSPSLGNASIFTYDVNSEHGRFLPTNSAQFPAQTPSAVASVVTPDGANLYVLYGATTDVQTGLPVDNGQASIVHYGIRALDGDITALDTAETGGTEPVALAIDPGGNYLYAVDSYRPGYGNGSPGPGDLTIFQLQNGVPSLPSNCTAAKGSITAQGNGCYYSVGFGPRGVVQSQSANGKTYVYVANSGNTAPQTAGTCYGTVSGFTLGTDGSLTALNFNAPSGSCPGGTPDPAGSLPLGTTPWGITTATVTGNNTSSLYLYVTDYGAGGVYSLATSGGVPQASSAAFQPSGGEPEHVLASTATTGSQPGTIFVSNFQQNTVSSYTLGTTGQLTPLANYVVGTGPTCMTIDQSGTYFYVTNYLNGNVSGFFLGPGGQLNELPNQPFIIGTSATGLSNSSPTCIAIAPNATPNP